MHFEIHSDQLFILSLFDSENMYTFMWYDDTASGTTPVVPLPIIALCFGEAHVLLFLVANNGSHE